MRVRSHSRHAQPVTSLDCSWEFHVLGNNINPTASHPKHCTDFCHSEVLMFVYRKIEASVKLLWIVKPLKCHDEKAVKNRFIEIQKVMVLFLFAANDSHH